jgi:hypothetical protein
MTVLVLDWVRQMTDCQRNFPDGCFGVARLLPVVFHHPSPTPVPNLGPGPGF